MTIRYEYLEPDQKLSDCAPIVATQILPLMQLYWKERGENVYKQPFMFNVEAFINQFWAGCFTIVVAYEEDTPVGFLLGIKFVPMCFRRNVIQIEEIYGPSPEIEKGMLEYLCNILKFQDLKELWVQNIPGVELPWNKLGTITTTRYARKP